MRTLWVPGVNNLDTFGRWRFEEFTDVFAIEETFGRLIRSVGTTLEPA
jgi:type III restriction enzyme